MNIHGKHPWELETQLANPINYETITTDYKMAVCSWHNAAHIFCFVEEWKNKIWGEGRREGGGGGCTVLREDNGGKFTAKTMPREIYNKDALPVWGKGQPSARGGSQGEKSNTQISCDHQERQKCWIACRNLCPWQETEITEILAQQLATWHNFIACWVQK